MSIFLILLAAGESKRLKSIEPKPYISVNNKTLIEHTIAKVRKIKIIKKIVLTYNKKHKKKLDSLNIKNIIKITGGKTRAQSSFLALKRIKNLKCSKVLIHDAARPNISSKLIKKIIHKLKFHNAVIPAIKAKDSIKLRNQMGSTSNVNRKNLLMIQTPQGFRYKNILKLHKKNKDINITDDASLFVNDNKKIQIIKGEEQNFKITNNYDLELFKNSKQKRINYGIGFDIHKLEKKRKLYLGGITIPYHLGLSGHSDGDSVLHALIDSLLGACKLKDIGTLFSDKNYKYKNIRSTKLLQNVVSLIKSKNYSINNIDINVIAQKPKIKKYKNKMIKVISKICKINPKQINIKGKTTEKLGIIGKEKALAAEVIASVIKYGE